MSEFVKPYNDDPFVGNLSTPVTTSVATKLYLGNLPIYRKGLSPLMRGLEIGMAHGYRLLSMIGPDFKTPRKLGHFLIAMKIDSFVNKKDFFRGIQLYLNDLKKQKPKNKNKKSLYPGEIEKITETFRRSNGIPFDREIRENFLRIAEKYKLKFNL